mgnify:FL=1
MKMHEMHNTHENEYLSSTQAANLLPLTTSSTLMRWAKAGRVPSIVLPSGRRVFRRADIEAILEPTEVSAAVETDRMVDQPLPGLEGVA